MVHAQRSLIRDGAVSIERDRHTAESDSESWDFLTLALSSELLRTVTHLAVQIASGICISMYPT